MVELDNFKTELATYKGPLQEVKAALDLVNKQQKIQEWWNNHKRFKIHMMAVPEGEGT